MWTFVQRRAIASYFALTFAISWGGIIGVIVFAGTGLVASAEDFTRLIPVWSPLLVLGPSAAGLAITILVGGRAALRAYVARLTRWRVELRWVLAAVLLGPATYLAASIVLSAVSRDYLPALVTADDRSALLARGIPVALLAGVFEELGWTGFAIPELRRRHDATRTGLIVGALWGLWHVLPKLFGAAVNDVGAYLPVDMVCAIVGLTGYRVLMVWLYDRTHSVPVAMVAHAGITGSMMILQPMTTGSAFAVVSVAQTIIPWLVVGAIALAKRASFDARWPRVHG